MKKFIIIFMLLASHFAYSQQIVSGTITDQHKVPIENITITVKGTDLKTSSDIEGKYSISVPTDKKTLEFSKSGYRVQEVEINSNTINLTMNLLSEIDVFELSLEELLNVEVTSVSKKAESVLTAPQTVIVLSSEELINRGYTDLEQVLHDLPGFDISKGRGCEWSQIYQRGYRSNNTDRTMMMIDGIEQNDLWSGSSWIDRQFPISNIKRIEVVYGPASTVYGANAFLGVINVITKDETDILGNEKKIGGTAYLGYGNWNTKFGDVTICGRYKDVALTITSRIYQSDNMDLSNYQDWNFDLSDFDVDYYMNVLETTNQDSAKLAMNLDKEGYKVHGSEHSFENKTNNIFFNTKVKIKDLTVGFQYWRRDQNYGAWYRDIYEFGNWVPSHSYIFTKYEKNITDKLTISNYNTFKINRIAGSSNHDYWYVGYINSSLGMSDLASNTLPYWYESYYATFSQQFRTETKAIFDISEKLNITTGLEYRQSMIQGNYFVSEDENPEETATNVSLEGGNYFFISDIGLYSQLSYKIVDNLAITIGGRADNNKIRINGGYGTVFNPKAAIVFSPKQFIFKFIYSEAFKDADNLTKYSKTAVRIPNPSLEPEKVKNFEFNAGMQISENLFFDITAYQSNYSNIVNEVSITFTDENGNIIEGNQNQPIGELKIQGLQSRINYKFHNYTAFAYYTFTDPYSINEGKEIRIGDIASHKICGGINALFFRKLNVNLTCNYVGEKPTGSNTTISSNPYDKIDKYYIINSAITYNIIKGLAAQFSINNILDTEYYHPGVRNADGDYYSARIPQFGRNFLFKLILEF